ncbi:sentrin-specific protease 8 [Cavenderia fasciculata]|uniref:Sentrin-specific protease 8 n=1 Tax=Cavenderia fasciculata TaxID=261658 RepID=F4QAZ0_CACFS|nr:sentrin-specific protease 8 [Cavenderia fasciculata]EGG14762.1 sentrin-specific protease 8 [Cavenderia fasciculata]|eukprot:XP_004351278.1 sentrin-specific protease 8 [Cavenderia fasciculata]
MSSDPLVLSYGDTSLYQSDIDILKQRYQWLNDAIIQFFFEYLSEESFKEYLDRICFMSASTVFMLHFIQDASVSGLKDIIGGLKLDSKDIVFIPINNNQDPNVIAGGSHWSLLVFIKALNCYYYYDSLPNSSEGNRECACLIAKTLSPLLLPPTMKWNVSSMFKIRQAPKQSNGYDCGLASSQTTNDSIKHDPSVKYLDQVRALIQLDKARATNLKCIVVGTDYQDCTVIMLEKGSLEYRDHIRNGNTPYDADPEKEAKVEIEPDGLSGCFQHGGIYRLGGRSTVWTLDRILEDFQVELSAQLLDSANCNVVCMFHQLKSDIEKEFGSIVNTRHAFSKYNIDDVVTMILQLVSTVEKRTILHNYTSHAMTEFANAVALYPCSTWDSMPKSQLVSNILNRPVDLSKDDIASFNEVIKSCSNLLKSSDGTKQFVIDEKQFVQLLPKRQLSLFLVTKLSQTVDGGFLVTINDDQDPLVLDNQTKLILATGPFPATDLILKSFPHLSDIVGKDFSSHSSSSVIFRIRKNNHQTQSRLLEFLKTLDDNHDNMEGFYLSGVFKDGTKPLNEWHAQLSVIHPGRNGHVTQVG